MLLFQLIPVLLECFSFLTEDAQDKDLLYGLLLVLSGILTEKNGNYYADIFIVTSLKFIDYVNKILLLFVGSELLILLFVLFTLLFLLLKRAIERIMSIP